MTRPDEALERAREAAERKRAEGRYGEPGHATLDASITDERPSRELLAEWAAIEVDEDLVYSTRRLGAPVTAFKRLLLRLLRQYHVELEARQTRFNMALLAHFEELERRVERLERESE